MSHLLSFIQFLNKFSNEDPRIEELLKNIESMEKENASLQAQCKEQETDNMRLQIELFNLETMVEPLRHLPDEESIETTNMQLMETCTNIRYAMSQIDFSKIAQWNHNQMEKNYRKEWQQLQDYTVSLIEWHKKMEQRDVVQRYRKVEKVFKEIQQNVDRSSNDHKKTVEQIVERLNEAEEKLNILILSLVEGSVKLNEFREIDRHLNILKDLEGQRAELRNKWEFKKNKTLTAIMIPGTNSFNENHSSTDMFQCDMPKFPSFNDIINSFNLDLNQGELIPQITMIENTTNIMVKSILRNSQDNSMQINQSITTKHTKHVHFKMQLEDKLEFRENTTSDLSSDDSTDTKIEVAPTVATAKTEATKQVECKNVIPIVDPLTASEIESKASKESQVPKRSNKPKIEILENIVIKTSTSDDKSSESYLIDNKENVSTRDDQNSKSEEDTKDNNRNNNKECMPPPKTIVSNRKKKSMYDGFLEASLSLDASSDDSSTSFTKSSKELEMFFSKSRNIPDFGLSEEFSNATESNADAANNITGEALDFGTQVLNFGSNDDGDGDDDIFASKSGFMDFFN